MTHKAFTEKVSVLMRRKTPFLFVVDFEKNCPKVYTWEEAAAEGYFFSVNGQTNATAPTNQPSLSLQAEPMDEEVYHNAFDQVVNELQQGNSFLLNLTFPSPIQLKGSLEDVFHQAKAPYKLHKADAFTVFSPECFIRIKDGRVATYPMKGTIDASLPNALETLQRNPKEQYEHNTIVDLMRNDLSMIATEVTVTQFRYPQQLQTAQGELWQTSSEIRGRLKENWEEQLGELLLQLLPAGSVSGAPKDKTCAIIREAEGQERGYYTGVFGIFDGQSIDSGVMIRYIEQKNGRTYFRSGGGITALSKADEEYHELIRKVYLPVF